MSVDRTATVIQCIAIEKRKQPVKQKLYTLSVTWSDESQSQTTVDSSTLIEWRMRLKNEYSTSYKSQALVPELPADKRIYSKKDEKRRKAIDEFFKQILELPDVTEKHQMLQNLLDDKPQENVASPDENQYNYADINSTMPLTASDTKNEELLYADLDFAEFEAARRAAILTNSKVTKQQRPQQATIYTEVVPIRRTADVDVTTNPEETDDKQKQDFSGPEDGSKSDDDEQKIVYAEISRGPSDDSSPTEPTSVTPRPPRLVYTDVIVNRKEQTTNKVDLEISSAPPRPPSASKASTASDRKGDRKKGRSVGNSTAYENTELNSGVAKSEAGYKFYMAKYANTPSDDADSNGRLQQLPVQVGDVIRVSDEKCGQVFGILCSRAPVTELTRLVEGWVPLSVLTSCKPDVVESAESLLPVVKVQSEYIAMQKSTSENTVSSSHLETTPDIHIFETDESTSSSVPKMPLRSAPLLNTPLKKGADKQLLKTTSPNRKFPNVEAVPGIIRVVAVSDWQPSGDIVTGSISFNRGDRGNMLYFSDRGWMCVDIGQQRGWVPGDYWRIINGEDLTRLNEAPWLVGELSRVECEKLLLKHGRHRDFVVRSSPNLSGQFALSVRNDNRVHHFPIVPTEDGKYFIGQHHFSTMLNVIIHYGKSTLFIDERGNAVTLGRPFVK